MDLLSAMATFVRIVDAGSLSKAAETLKVSPAAVSRQLTALEHELGATLVVRTTRRIALTEEGARFREHAERTLDEAEEARASVRRNRAAAGLVTVSAPTAIGLSGLDDAVAALVAKHPGLRIDLRLEDHPVDILADGIDVAVRAGLAPPDSTTFVAHALGATARVLVASPSYLRRRGEPRDPRSLADHDALVHLHAGGGVGVWRLEGDEGLVQVPVTGPLRATALHVLRSGALAGAGIALLPRFLVARDVAEGRLRALDLGGFKPVSQSVHALVRAESNGRARVRVFIERAREHMRALLA